MRTDLPVVRSAVSEDYESVARLIFRSHTISFARFATEDWVRSRRLEDYLARWQSVLESPKADDATFVAIAKGEVVGTVRVARFEASESESDAQLIGMHVEPDLTGGGIGTQLMNAAIGFIRERDFIRVELGVIASNTGARRFYEAHGWALLRELPDGIEGVPAAIYELNRATS